MKINYDIKNKVAFVTGANRGIGKAIVDAFLHNKAMKVYAAVRSLDSAVPLTRRYGEKVVAVQLDLAKPETIIAAAGMANDAQGGDQQCGYLYSIHPLDTDAVDSLELGMKINVLGLIRMAQAFAPFLR